MMAAIRGRDTEPEIMLRQALSTLGVRGYRTHRREIPGTPDVAWVGRRIAVFVDGAFWHGHRSAYRHGQSGPFWDKKIARNKERDREVNSALRKAGWTVVRLWDFDVKRNPTRCARCVLIAFKRADMMSRKRTSRPAQKGRFTNAR